MKRKILFISLSVVAVVAILVASFVLPLFYSEFKLLERIVYIYPGLTADEQFKSVESQLGEEFGERTVTMLNLLEVDLSNRIGAYSIKRGTTPYQAARILQRGGQTGIRVVINNVRTLDQLAERVTKDLLMSKEELLELLNDKDFCAKYGKTPQTIATIFFPDTYDFFWTVTPEKFVDRMFGYYNKFWTDERKEKATKLGLTPDGVSTIASIAEEETAKRDERGKVARLYVNRVKMGMPLQADPTVKFALGNFSIRRIYAYMLKVDSPYNTYKNKGLPPGPIRMPEKATLESVLNAPAHNYIYMCAKEDFSGYHNFAVSYADHKANARRYQRELNRRKIK